MPLILKAVKEAIDRVRVRCTEADGVESRESVANCPDIDTLLPPPVDVCGGITKGLEFSIEPVPAVEEVIGIGGMVEDESRRILLVRFEVCVIDFPADNEVLDEALDELDASDVDFIAPASPAALSVPVTVLRI